MRLEALLFEGGLDLDTRLDGAIVCRTLVQLDGDVISWISPRLLEKPELLERHYGELRQQLRSLEAHGVQGYQKLVVFVRRARWGTGTLGVLCNAASWPALSAWPAFVSSPAFVGYFVHLLLFTLSYGAWHFAPPFIGRLTARAVLRRLVAPPT